MTPEQVSQHFAIPGWQSALEQEALPHYLREQRWFGGKNRPWDRLRILDWCVLGPAHEERSPVFLLAEAAYHAGPSEVYGIPVWLGGGPSVQVDASLLVVAAQAFMELMHTRGKLPMLRGELDGFHTDVFKAPRTLQIDPPEHLEQSNTSLRVGEKWMLKLVRRLEPGANPDVEIGRFLLERTRFRRTPALAGWVEYSRNGQEPTALGILQEFVGSKGSGWDQALDSARREAALELSSAKFDASVGELVPDGALDAELLGRRTAEMHLALASDHRDPVFAPEPLTTADLAAVSQRIHEHIEEATPRLSQLAAGHDSAAEPAAKLLERRSGVLDHASLQRLASLGAKTRVHGDYHLGQVLWTGKDFWIIDFEGEPTRPLAERRAKHSPLKDVAGMLRSFDYAAQSVLREATLNPLAKPAMEMGAKRWQQAATVAFVQGYHHAVGRADFLPPDEASFEALLSLLLLDKAVYELHYELNNRPDWAVIPLRGILDLLQPKLLQP